MRISFRDAALATVASLALTAQAAQAGTVFYDSGFTGQNSATGFGSADLGLCRRRC